MELTRIIILPNAILQIPDKLKNNDNNPIVTYQLGKMKKKY